jgi:hypothetical protein
MRWACLIVSIEKWKMHILFGKPQEKRHGLLGHTRKDNIKRYLCVRYIEKSVN